MPSVKVDIIGDSSSLQRAYQKAATETKAFGTHATTSAKAVDGLHSSVTRGAVGLSTFAKSALLAGGALVGIGSLYEGIKKTVSAAEGFNQAQRQLDAQLRANGESFKAVSPWVDKLQASQVQLGFTSTQTEKAFTQLDRASGSAALAYKYMGVTADLAAARHIDLSKAALLVGKVIDGNTAALNRYGIAVPKGTSVTDALRIAQEKLSGQASASVTPFEKFRAVLNNIEVEIGNVLLPVITKYLDKVTVWMSQANHQKEITDTVRTALHDLGIAFNIAKGIVEDMIPIVKQAYAAFKTFSDNVGGAKHAIEILGAALVAWKLASTLGGIGSAAGSAGPLIATLTRNLKALSLIGAIAIPIAIILNHQAIDDYISKYIPGFLGGGHQTTGLGTPAQQSKFAGTFGQSTLQTAIGRQTARSGTVGVYGPAAPSAGLGGVSTATTASARSYIQQMAAQFGLDPAALIGVANNESAGWSGAAGDNQTSFGPFQMHIGGALPTSIGAKGAAYANAWAWSPAGINYALNEIAKAGAKGLRGSAAVSAIVNNFERPASTTADIAAGNANLRSATGLPPGSLVLPTAGADAAKAAKTAKDAAAALAKKAATAATQAAAKLAQAAHAAAEVAFADKPVLGVDVAKLQKAFRDAAAAIAKPFQGVAAKASTQVGELQQLMSVQVPGRITDYTSAITELVSDQVRALENGIAKLKSKGMGDTAAAGKLQSALNAALASQEGLLQNAVQTARTAYDTVVSKFTNSFGKLTQDITSQFQANTQAGIAALGPKYSQGSKTPAEAALAAMQAADALASLTDALATAQQAGDQKQIDQAQRAIDEYDLALKATAERTKADSDYAAAVAQYQKDRDVQEQKLNTRLGNLATSVQNGTGSMKDLKPILDTFGIEMGSGKNGATAVVMTFAADLKSATTDAGGIISSLTALQQAFDALVGWVNDKTGSNVQTGGGGGGGDNSAGGIASGAVAGAAIGGGGGSGLAAGAAAGVLGGATQYFQSGVGTYGKKPMLAAGGFITRSGLAFIHAGETVVPAGKGGGNITINVQGFVGDERRLTDMVLAGLRRKSSGLTTLGLT